MDIPLIITYIITIICMFIINYQVNLAYYLSITIFFTITTLFSISTKSEAPLLSSVYIIPSLFLINNNCMVNPTSLGRNLIGIITALITIIMLKLNIPNYQILALLTIPITSIYIDNYILKYHQNIHIAKISPILLILSIILISTL